MKPIKLRDIKLQKGDLFARFDERGCPYKVYVWTGKGGWQSKPMRRGFLIALRNFSAAALERKETP